MARPANKDKLKRYRAEVERSRKWREHEQYDAQWERLVDLYRGRHYQRYVDEDRVVINMAFATINVIAPSIAVNNPKIVVNARVEENADGAVISEQVVNYHWRHGKFQKQIRRAVNDMLMVGHGWVKVGYAYTEEAKDAVASQEELDKTTVPAEEEEPEGYPCAETLTPKRVDRPFVERVSYKDIFVDPDASDPSELRWICQRVRRPVADVRRDTRYTTEGRKEVSAETKDRWNRTDMSDEHMRGQLPGGYVDVYEFYDLKAGKVCTFTKDKGEAFLVAPKDIPLPFPNPFIMFRDYDVPDVFYPMGELEAIEILQHELNETRTAQVLHRKRYNPKWLYREEVFPSQAHVDALSDDSYNALVPVDASSLASLDDAVVPMPTTTPPPEFYNQSQIIENDIDMVSGVSDYMRGQMPEIRRTATEAAMLQDAQQSRAADKLAKIEATTSEVAERIIAVLQTYTTGDQVALVTGINGIKLWVHYDRDDIAGEYLFEVEAGSTQPMNESFRRQSALQMVDALTPFMEAGVINMPAAAQHIINVGFGVKNAGHFVQMPPPPPEEMPAEGMGPPMMPAEAGGMPPEGGGMPPPEEEMAPAY